MGGGGGGSYSWSWSPYLFFKFLFGVLAMMGFSWFVLFGFLESGEKKPMTTLTNSSQDAKHRMDHLVKEKHVDPGQLDLYYAAKRRVRRGPDPIHNRRARKFRQPPGRV